MLKKVAIQGGAGAFHEIAARSYFGNQVIEILSIGTFDEIVQLVSDKKIDYGIMAIENTVAGSLIPNYALIREAPVKIMGEQYLRVKQNLMALPGQTIADITDDKHGSIPCNLGDATIQDPVYGVNKLSGQKTDPYLPNSVDIMAVGNLPNELPRDASRYFGEQLIKYILDDVRKGGSAMIERATILDKGKLTSAFEYLKDYASLD